jgi:hypothetical protein
MRFTYADEYLALSRSAASTLGDFSAAHELRPRYLDAVAQSCSHALEAIR